MKNSTIFFPSPYVTQNFHRALKIQNFENSKIEKIEKRHFGALRGNFHVDIYAQLLISIK